LDNQNNGGEMKTFLGFLETVPTKLMMMMMKIDSKRQQRNLSDELMLL
jgi:hypothetical protein